MRNGPMLLRSRTPPHATISSASRSRSGPGPSRRTNRSCARRAPSAGSRGPGPPVPPRPDVMRLRAGHHHCGGATSRHTQVQFHRSVFNTPGYLNLTERANVTSAGPGDPALRSWTDLEGAVAGLDGTQPRDVAVQEGGDRAL